MEIIQQNADDLEPLAALEKTLDNMHAALLTRNSDAIMTSAADLERMITGMNSSLARDTRPIDDPKGTIRESALRIRTRARHTAAVARVLMNLARGTQDMLGNGRFATGYGRDNTVGTRPAAVLIQCKG